MRDDGRVMDSDVVWNLDARHRPELEVEIEVVLSPHEIPGEHGAAASRDLEVDFELELAPDEIPGQYRASLRRDLEVEMSLIDTSTPVPASVLVGGFGDADADAWFVADDFYAAS